MKIVTWNCNGAFRKKFEKISFFNADIYVIQECENPTESNDKKYQEWAKNFLWIGDNKNKGLGVFAKKNIKLEYLNWSNQFQNHGVKHFLPCKIENDINLLAVWTHKNNSPNFGYAGQLWKYMQINKNRLENIIIAGDFNSNSIWDQWDRWWNHTDIVNELNEIGIKSFYHEILNEDQGKETIPTLFFQKKITRTYHIDYIFGSQKFIDKLNNNLDWYLVGAIFQRKQQLNYDLNNEQILKLSEWTKKEASRLNFKDAIYNVQNNSFNLNQNCLTVYKYIKELNIKVDKKTSLDLLSYFDIDSINSNYNESYSNYFENLINHIKDLESVKKRVFENLKNKIKYSSVLNNHIIFSFKYNQTENYKLIEDLLTEFLQELQVGHYHDNPLLVYYDKSKNFEFIKNNFPEKTTDLFWIIIDYLIENNEHIKFVEEKLLFNIDKTEDYNEKLKFSSKLLKINSKNALFKFYTILNYIKDNQLKGQFRLHDFNKSIYDYKNTEIETAVNLLELSYKYEFDSFENPTREVSAYLKRMVVEDKENYNKTKNLILEVINSNKGKIDNIQFLEYELNNLKEVFYSNYKSNYGLKDALKIISKIE